MRAPIALSLILAIPCVAVGDTVESQASDDGPRRSVIRLDIPAPESRNYRRLKQCHNYYSP